ncbi:MAG: inorganic phosphate transporter [Planctomycetes bacterium]|nr:inorganic phosphate transporter [Planctomycetota bacterium]
MDIYQGAIFILVTLAISDLIVGVSNDAANFLNSSIGSRVAPRYFIMIIASLGMLAGVLFSSGMMEVARKGIFHPQFFTMPELMAIFLAVMLTDIILLDLYNTFGLPTSTTVSIVFELLGAAVAVSLIKIAQAGESFGELVKYINTGKALIIISGILLSVVVAFFTGAVVQFVSRILFTFDFQKRIKRFGAVYGGVALASIIYFILIKGAKGASFISKETMDQIKENTIWILLVSFACSTVFLQILILFTRVHVLKVIILVGTFALAMAFAANDLVNFIGVPLAGISAYQEAAAGSDMLTQSMEALSQPVRSNSFYLLIAGAVMVVTLWISRKARTVSRTEVTLGRQEEGYERFEATLLSQTIVRIVASMLEWARKIIPDSMARWISGRLDRARFRPVPDKDGTVPSFDLVRASVNLMVASALISFATSLKLPLSTTYVTFMVSMGSSLSDQAWGLESAVYRVTGVLAVIGGWFFTAFMAFTVSLLIAFAVYFGQAPAVIAILGGAIFLILHNRKLHKSREKADQAIEVFNLKKIKDSSAAIEVSFEHTGIFLEEVKRALESGLEGLFRQDRHKLRNVRRRQKRLQQWANIIIANIFKVLRLLQREAVEDTQKYAQTVSTLQEIAESQRDVVMRAYRHVANNHAGLLEGQIEEMSRVSSCVIQMLAGTADAFLKKEAPDLKFMISKNREMRMLIHEFDGNQIMRIQDNTSKTRLSILFYGFMWNAQRIGEKTLYLLEIFQDSLRKNIKAKS